MDLTAKSLTELNAMTKTQIIAALTEDRVESKVTFQDGDRRGMLRQVVETRDIAGKLLSSREVTWTYYPAGNVRDITNTEKDAAGKPVSKPQVVKHAESGGLATGNEKLCMTL